MAIITLIMLILKKIEYTRSQRKTVSRPHTSLDYLATIVITNTMEARLSQDKVERIIYFIGTFLRRHRIEKTKIFTSLGTYQFCCKSHYTWKDFCNTSYKPSYQG